MPGRVARGMSEQLSARARLRLPGGVNSSVRLAAPRVVFERAKGAWLWDVDGNDYVDYLLGQGPSFLGHASREVNDAVAAACQRGMVYGAQHPLEIEAAERLCEAVGWPEQVRFGLSGTEMVQAALRLARAVTGRTRFVRFEGHYHGWLDNVLLAVDDAGVGPASAGQLAHHLDDVHVLPWNDAGALDALLAEHGEDIAAVIMEPVMCNAGAIVPESGYLDAVRRSCDEHGAVLIFDEVITGFRLGLGGGAQRYGVVPDLATYGKAMAGGWPVAALAGRGELMERFGTGEVNHSGTFNGSVMAAAATVVTIDLLCADPPYARIEEHGRAVMAGLGDLAAAHDLPLHLQGLPMAFHASFGGSEGFTDYRGLMRRDASRYARFAHRLVDHGVWVAGRGIWYVSAAHTEAEVTAVLGRVEAALDAGAP